MFPVGAVLYFLVSCAFAAPTVHLVDQDSNNIAGMQSFRTNHSDAVEPMWSMTVKPLVETSEEDRPYQPSIGTDTQYPAQASPPRPYYYQPPLSTVMPAITPQLLYPNTGRRFKQQWNDPIPWWGSVQPIVQPPTVMHTYPVIPHMRYGAQPWGGGVSNADDYQQQGYQIFR